MAAPTAPTQQLMPDWTNLVDNWREQDAEWLRNRTIQVYATPTARDADAVLTAARSAGFLAHVVTPAAGHPGGPDWYNGSAWESIRYPNLSVISDGTSVTLRRYPAGTGVQLINDGSVNAAKLFVGTGGVGTTLDNTGISLKIGADTAKIATDANGFTMDSPVAITGALSATGALTAASASIPTINATTSLTTPQVNATNVTATAAVQGVTVTAGTVQLAGNQLKATGGTAALTLAADSSVTLVGTTVNIAPSAGVTIAGTGLTLSSPVSFTSATSPSLAPAGKTAVPVAGVISVSGNVAPSANAPDGTLYVTY